MLRRSKPKTGQIHQISRVQQNLQRGTKSVMDPRLWHQVAAVSGVAALGLGTYGAHFFKPKNPAYKEVWQTASVYHLVHTAALLAAPITKYPTIFGVLLTTGILGFSGTITEHRNLREWLTHYLATVRLTSRKLGCAFIFIPTWCYAVAYLEDRTYSGVAPYGGFAFIGAWASLLF